MANGGIIGPINTTAKRKKPKVSVFTATGSITTESDTSLVNATVIAGGGAGGADRAGGGGAGGYRTFTCQPVTGSSPYAVTIGAGGVGGTGNGTSGSNSSLVVGGCTTQTSTGGGRGGSDRSLPAGCSTGATGGSGGGGGQCQPGGAGNTPPTSPPQGNTGGTATTSVGGGGGGSGGTGYPGNTACNQSRGGAGSPLQPYLSSFGGATTFAAPAGTMPVIAGGGGGGSNLSNNCGFGGGTPGGITGSANAADALAGTGGGGGGGGPGSPPGACSQGGNGASGLVTVQETNGSGPGATGVFTLGEVYEARLNDAWPVAPFGGINILAIGGGGSTIPDRSGGGGAGGYRFNTNLELSLNNNYTISVGAGGAQISKPAAPTFTPSNTAGRGNDSSFSGPDIQTFTAGGGGRGGVGGYAIPGLFVDTAEEMEDQAVEEEQVVLNKVQ
jgi:hypothetical protein